MNEIILNNGKMTSLHIAQITGKLHKNLMRDIRNMEDAWTKINGRKFELISYTDSMNRKKPMYELSKTECLYIATKFNDEARAKLILRWEQLENERKNLSRYEILQMAMKAEEEAMMIREQKERLEQQALLQEAEIRKAVPKVEYHDKVMSSVSTYITNQIAKELGMSAISLNRKLKDMGVQYKQNQTWLLYRKHQNKGYTKTKTHTYIDHKTGESKTSMQTVWTEKGRYFIHSLLNDDIRATAS